MYAFETERLLLRRFTRADEELHALVFTGVKTLDEVRGWLVYRAFEGANTDLGYWAVVRKDDSALLGMASLQYYVAWWLVLESEPDDPYNRIEVELDCELGRAFRRQGFATEASEALIEHALARLRIPRLVTTVDRRDVPALALLRRLGFRLSQNLHPTEGPGEVVGILDNDRVL